MRRRVPTARVDDGNGGEIDAPIDMMIDGTPRTYVQLRRVYRSADLDDHDRLPDRAVVIADAADGLAQPVAAIVAGGGFDGKIYVVNQTDDTLRAVEPTDGTTTLVVAAAAWPKPAALLTTIAWDAQSIFDGNLYVGDQGWRR
ncbi:MAG: hypothetical protein QM736_14585 [Vicinamibacterales bacterium]